MNCAPTYSYNDALFRQQFAEFDSATTYPETLLQNYWDQAGTIVANTTYGFLAQMGGPMALNLLTAHLAKLFTIIGAGETPGIVTSATIDRVSVTLEPPPAKSQFEWWLNQTPYGAQLLVMLNIAGNGGLYTPGSLGRAGFFASGTNGAYFLGPGYYGNC